MFFKKKVLSEDFVEFSFGKVFFKRLTNKIVNDVFNQSFYGTKAFNINLFFQLFEYYLLDLKKKKIDNLFIEDSNLLRQKIKEILFKYDLLQEEKKVEKSDEADIFHKEDVEWFKKQESSALNKLYGNLNGRK